MRSSRCDADQLKNVLKDNGYVLLLLKCLGIDILCEKRSFSSTIFIYFIVLLQHLFYVERLATFIPLAISSPGSPKVLIAFTLQSTSILFAWHAVNSKRSDLRKMLCYMRCSLKRTGLKKTEAKRKLFPSFTKFMVVLICIVPIVYGVGEQIGLFMIPNISLYTFVVNKDSLWSKAHFILRGILCSVQRDTFCGAVCFLYCLACWRVCQSLKQYGNFLEESLVSNNSLKFPREALPNFLLIVKVAENVDDAFQQPIFFMMVVYGISLFTLLATAYEALNGYLPFFTMLHIATTLVTAGLFMFLNVEMAARIPLEMERNLQLFRRLREKLVQHPFRLNFSSSQIDLLNVIKRKPAVTLSGCHIIYFKRSLILSIVGSLITYGLLVLNFK